ncbi:MAG: SUMF1/EgtB/PvdO family nonheme iron enzyme [Rikenellaceae bacterium]|jgi:formylglycine-generating enzyme required for sulfatase activity|nr:SUMF1/EgtB/PvdO family nonheme iron enzyme [Rikenellaceae bacterium]
MKIGNLFVLGAAMAIAAASCKRNSSSESDPTLNVNPATIDLVSSHAGDTTFAITSNRAWTAVSSESWCTVSPASGNGDVTITVTLEANTGHTAKSATITISAGAVMKTVVVNQPPMIVAELFTQGVFIMGSPDSEPYRVISCEAQHEVTLTHDFYMSRYEITNAQYAEFLNANGVDDTGKKADIQNDEVLIIDAATTSIDYGVAWSGDKWEPKPGKGNHAVSNVTWYGAKAYATWVGGSLPTEAQWEYMCRGEYPNKATETATLPFGVGDGTKLIEGMAHFTTISSYDLAATPPGSFYDPNGTTMQSTTDVGSYQPNNYGLYDMHGNVQEWCEDWFANDYGCGNAAVTDPTGPATGTSRVIRGGSWHEMGSSCRSAARNGYTPHYTTPYIGFRVVWVQP